MSYLDDVALAGLRLAHTDLKSGKLAEVRQARISTTISEVMDDISTLKPERGATPDVEAAAALEEVNTEEAELPVLTQEARQEEWKSDSAIICIGARSSLDEAAATLLAGALNRHAGPVRLLERSVLSSRIIEFAESREVRLACVSYLDVKGLAQLRYDVRRIRSRMPRAMVMLCCWDAPERLEDIKDQSGADFVVTNIREAVEACYSVATPAAALGLSGSKTG